MGVVAAPQAPGSNHVTSAPVPDSVPVIPTPNPTKRKRDVSTAKDLPSSKLRVVEDDDDDQETDSDYEEALGYDFAAAQAVMEEFLCERLPFVAARVMFPGTHHTPRAQEEETELLTNWLYERSLVDEAIYLIEDAFEDQDVMSGDELGELIWDWYEDYLFPELEG